VGAVFGLVAVAVVVTHHVSSYVLLAYLVAVCVIHWRLHGGRARRGGWPRGSVWPRLSGLRLAGGGTVGYLSPVLTSALKQVVQDTRARDAGARAVRESGRNGRDAACGDRHRPERDHAARLGVLVGVRLVWQQRWRNPLMVLLVFCAFIYLGTLPLRFVPAAWESGQPRRGTSSSSASA